MSVYITREMVRQAAHEWRHKNTIGILDRLVRSVKGSWKRRETANELHNLSDRELRDIGIYRGDIPRVVNQLGDEDLGLARAAPRATHETQGRVDTVSA